MKKEYVYKNKSVFYEKYRKFKKTPTLKIENCLVYNFSFIPENIKKVIIENGYITNLESIPSPKIDFVFKNVFYFPKNDNDKEFIYISEFPKFKIDKNGDDVLTIDEKSIPQLKPQIAREKYKLEKKLEIEEYKNRLATEKFFQEFWDNIAKNREKEEIKTEPETTDPEEMEFREWKKKHEEEVERRWNESFNLTPEQKKIKQEENFKKINRGVVIEMDTSDDD